jgi:hypothetical protein
MIILIHEEADNSFKTAISLKISKIKYFATIFTYLKDTINWNNKK